jgi:hypothetical protein
MDETLGPLPLPGCAGSHRGRSMNLNSRFVRRLPTLRIARARIDPQPPVANDCFWEV